jgi:hypothetical protein
VDKEVQKFPPGTRESLVKLPDELHRRRFCLKS